MTALQTTLPHLLCRQSTRSVVDDLQSMPLSEVRSMARHWLDPDLARLNRQDLVNAFRAAAKDPAVTARVLGRVSSYEIQVVEAYRRYGGVVEGPVIQLDLQARGLLEVVETIRHERFVERSWEREPFTNLVRRGILIPVGLSSGYNSLSHRRYRPGNDMDRLGLHPGVAAIARPAGPPGWTIAPAAEVPLAITRRSVSELVLDLSRVYAWLSARGSAKLRASGFPAAPTLKSLAKAVALDSDRELDFPEPEALYFDILLHAGAIRVAHTEAFPVPAAADRLFGLPTAEMVHALARGWLFSRGWADGVGAVESYSYDDSDKHVTIRQDLAWALASLVHAGDHWYDLSRFIAALYEIGKNGSTPFYMSKAAWDPGFSENSTVDTSSVEGRNLRQWYNSMGTRYANMLMVSLVALGLVERGRFGAGGASAWGFRFTEIGRAIFGAPEIPTPAEPDHHHFLLVQPNFDVVAYLEQASPRTVSILGRIAEHDSASTGSVQTTKLTQARVYQALESGLHHDEIVGFLNKNSQRELPRNLVQSLADWSGKRESLAVRSGLALLGFPTTAERDAHLAQHPGSEPCGSLFLILSQPNTKEIIAEQVAVSDHLLGGRKSLTATDDGELRPKGSLDIVVEARLRRIAEPTAGGWKLTRESIRRAAELGLRSETILEWLEDHLTRPISPMLKLAIGAWTDPGKSPKVAIGEAVLLHVPDQLPFHTIEASAMLAPCFLGSPGKHWLLVKPGERQALEQKLRELGLNVLDGLDSAAHQADAGPRPEAKAGPKGPGRPRGRPKRSP